MNFKKFLASSAISALALLSTATPAFASKPIQVDSNGVETAWVNSNCTNIQSGLLKDTLGNTLEVGYDQFGYNYQAHMFNGTYDSVDRVLDGKYFGSVGDYVDDNLSMKWSDEWLANVDCDGDLLLDRGLVGNTPTGTSMGWLTNHVEGEYISSGDSQHYTYFVKIGWVGPGGSLWGEYDILQEEYQDPTGMYHAKNTAPGLGLNDHWTQ